LVLLSLGGFLLHLKLHPVSFDPGAPENPAHMIPFIIGILGVIAVPALMAFKRTCITGYCINGMSVVIGVIIMLHFTHASPPELSISGMLLYTTIPYIIILFPKLLIGQSVLLFYYPHGRGRMFTAGWWVRHFIYLSIFYMLGFFLWK
jgi:hypothetical protein